ncbi:hypothetical protein BC835DRAFT_1522117 [Cytidiella melzeri]|nr:hypothetical protein BC835DRAFT_1522117 [Cytidiella melzeri]
MIWNASFFFGPTSGARVTQRCPGRPASTAQTGKKNRKLDKKESKNKLFTLTLDNNKDSYVRLLQTILDRHGEPLYKVKASKPYSFKYLPARAAKKDALDVETLEEYMDMIVQLNRNRTSKVTIYAQFKDIKKTVRHQSNTNMSSDSKSLDGDKADESDNERPNMGDMYALKSALAGYRVLLEKKYSNERDGGFTFTYNSGYQLKLSPIMLKEWSIALKDNVATLSEPPCTKIFDPNNWRLVLDARRAARHAASVVAVPLLDQGTALAQLSAAILELTKRACAPATLRTPERARTASIGSLTSLPSTNMSVPIPRSPNDLPQFLKFMKDTHGVVNAHTYRTSLSAKGYGPDILDQVDIKDLTAFNVGLTPGDAIRFRNAAPVWWNSRGKRPRELFEEDVDFNSFLERDERGQVGDGEPDKCIHYKGRWPDGTRMSWFEVPLIVGDRQFDDDFIEYQDSATLEWKPIPLGFTAPDRTGRDGYSGINDFASVY